MKLEGAEIQGRKQVINVKMSSPQNWVYKQMWKIKINQQKLKDAPLLGQSHHIAILPEFQSRKSDQTELLSNLTFLLQH